MDNKSKFKKFLAAASTAAIIVGSSNAYAGTAVQTRNIDPANMTTGAGLEDPAAMGADFAIVTGNNDTLTINHAVRIDVGDNGGPNVPVAVTVNAAGATISLRNNAGNAGVAANFVSINGGGADVNIELFDDASILGLTGTGNVYQRLSSITGVGKIGTVNIGDTANTITYNGTITANKVNVNAGGNAVNLGGAISANTFKVGAADTITLDGTLTATNVKFTAAATVNVNAGITGDIDFAANDAALVVKSGITIDGHIDGDSGGGGAAAGKLEFAGAGKITGQIGVTDALTYVKTLGAGTVKIIADANHQATNFYVNSADSILQVTGGAATILTGAVDGAGTVEFLGQGKIAGAIGGVTTLGQLKIGNGKVTLPAGNSLITTTTFTDAAGSITIDLGNGGGASSLGVDAGTIRGAGTIKATNAAAGDNLTIRGTIGAEDVPAGKVQSDGVNAEVIIEKNAEHRTGLHFSGDNAAQITINGGNATNIIGNATAAAVDGRGVLQFNGKATFTGNLGEHTTFGAAADRSLAQVVANTADQVTIDGTQHAVAQFKIVDNSVGTGFTFTDNTAIKGSIHNANANKGTINFQGSGSITGITGDNAALAAVNLTGGEGTVFKFGDIITATNINIGAGTLEMNNGGNIAGTIKFTDADHGRILISGAGAHTIGAINADTGSRGTVEIGAAAGNITFTGAIGDTGNANKALNSLIVKNAAGTLIFTKQNAAINEISFANNSNSTLKIGNGKTYRFGNITTTTGGQGNITIDAGNATLISPDTDETISFGTATERLGTLTFNGNHTLTIGNAADHKIDLFFTALDNNGGGNNHGTLVFKGISNFFANTQGNGALAAITLEDGANVTISSPTTNVNGATTVGAGATLTITGTAYNNIGAITTAAANATLRFANNTGKLTVAEEAGTGFTTIEFAGTRDVIFAGKFIPGANKTISFTGTQGITVDFQNAANTNIGDVAIVNNSTVDSAIPTFTIHNNHDFTKSAGTAEKQVNISINAAAVTAIIKAENGYAGANFIGKGIVKFDVVAGGTINSAGTNQQKLAEVNFTSSGQINDGLYADAVTVDANMTATVGGVISTGTFTVGDNATLTLLNGANVQSELAPANAANGTVSFAGGGTLSQDIGEELKNFAIFNIGQGARDADNPAALQISTNDVEIYATQSNIGGGADVVLNKDLTFHNAVAVNAAHINLKGNNIEFTPAAGGTAVSFAGENHIALAATGMQDINNTNNGRIVVSNNAVLTFAAGTKFDVTVDDGVIGGLISAGTTRTLTMLQTDVAAAEGQRLAAGSVTVTNNLNKSSFSKFEVNEETYLKGGNIELVQSDNSENAMKYILGDTIQSSTSNNVKRIANAKTGTSAHSFKEILANIANHNSEAETKAAVTEAFNRQNTNSENITRGVESMIGSQMDVSENRLNSITSTPGVEVERTRRMGYVESTSGIAAGDDAYRFGAWVSPFYSNTSQKARKGLSGHKTEAFGATFGVDTRANDGLIVGAAVTMANSEMKHKNYKSGDNTKINTTMLSLYALQQITESWYFTAAATIGSNDIKNSEARVHADADGVPVKETANGKYNSMSFSGEAMFGYNYITEQITVTPTFGLRYTRVNNGGYKETGTTNQNFDVSTKASNKFEAIVGARVSAGTFEMNGIVLTPEVHGFIRHDLMTKKTKSRVEFEGAGKLDQISAKPIRTTYNVGLALNSAYSNMEYGVGYDLHMAEKRIGHQGTLKVRVNF